MPSSADQKCKFVFISKFVFKIMLWNSPVSGYGDGICLISFSRVQRLYSLAASIDVLNLEFENNLCPF